MCMKTTRANTVEPSDAVNRCTAAHVTSHHNTLSSSYTRTMFKRQHVLVPNHRFLLSWPSEIGRSTSTSSHTSSRHIILSGPLFKGRTRRPVWPYRYPSNRTHRAHILVPLIKRDFHSQSVTPLFSISITNWNSVLAAHPDRDEATEFVAFC